MNPPDPMIETNDPRLTAYVLGELAPHEISQIEDALKSSPELRTAVADIRRATESIASVFQSEPSLQLSPEQKAELLAEAESANTDVHSFADNVAPTVNGEHYRPSSGSMAHWIKIAIAAGLAGLLLGGAYYFSEVNRSPIAASDKAVLETTVELEESESLSRDKSTFMPEDDDGSDRPLEKMPINKRDIARFHRKSKGVENSRMPLGIDGIQAESSETEGQASYLPQATPSRAMPANKANSYGDAVDIKQSPLPKMVQGVPNSMAPAGRGALAKDAPRSPAEAETNDSRSRYESSKPPETESPPASQASDALVESELNLSKLKVASNSPLLLRAQQSLDQSTLGSLNLKVVAPNASNQFFYSIGEGGNGRRGFEGDGGESFKADEQPAKNGVANGKVISNAPTTFELQISDQDAKRTVQLLANQADPLQQRRLSFNELIGLQKASSGANDSLAGRMDLSDADGDVADRALKSKADLTGLDDKKPQEETDASQNAAAVLASKLREHVNRPLDRYSNAPALQELGALADAEDSKPDRVAAAKKIKRGTKLAEKADAGNQFAAPAQSTKLGFLADEPSERSRSNDFYFDYTQVIQQLKSNLEIRNQSVPPVKQ